MSRSRVASGAHAESTLVRALAKMPGLPAAEFNAIALAASGGDYGTAERLARSFEQRHGTDPQWRQLARRRLADLALVKGKLAEADDQLSEAMAVSEAGQDTSGYLDLAIDRAMIDIINFRGQRARGLRQIERALAKYPIRSLAPASRPYLALAYALCQVAGAGRGRDNWWSSTSARSTR